MKTISIRSGKIKERIKFHPKLKKPIVSKQTKNNQSPLQKIDDENLSELENVEGEIWGLAADVNL